MAKVVFTAIVAEVSGRLSGSVFQRSVGGYQLHSLGVPINRRTGAQQLNRVTLEFLASNWQTLSPAEKLTYPGATNQERFTSYISENFRYAWQSGSLVPDSTSKIAFPLPEWDAAFATVSSGDFLFNAHYSNGGNYTASMGNSTFWFREFTAPGSPINGTWRAYKILQNIAVEDEVIGVVLNSVLFPSIVIPPVGWQSEFYWHYETATHIGTTNIIGFERQS